MFFSGEFGGAHPSVHSPSGQATEKSRDANITNPRAKKQLLQTKPPPFFNQSTYHSLSKKVHKYIHVSSVKMYMLKKMPPSHGEMTTSCPKLKLFKAMLSAKTLPEKGTNSTSGGSW